MTTQADIDALLAEASGLVDAAGQPRPSVEERAGGVTAGRKDENSPARQRQPARVNIDRLMQLEVPVIVKLAEREMTLAEVMKLALGAIVEFEAPADGELSLMINNKCLAYGSAVKVGENFGLKVTEIASPQQRVKALGR